MPSGPPELHRKWCDRGPYEGHGDSNALHFLGERGIRPSRGGIFYLQANRPLDDEENSALDYLFMEWDFACQVLPASDSPAKGANGTGTEHKKKVPNARDQSAKL
jgi:hypothetical protein